MSRALSNALLGLALLACEKVGDRTETRPPGNARRATNLTTAASSTATATATSASSATPAPRASPAAPHGSRSDAGAPSTDRANDAAAPPQEPGTADRDATNDELVAPPAAIEDCETRLQALGVSFSRAELKVRTTSSGVVCGTPQAVSYKGRSGGPRWSSAPLVSCTLALALARFEMLADAEAKRYLGAGLRSIEHGGSYNCRKMARFTGMVSEHSYGNAIDLRSFRLTDGRTVSVLKHFGRPAREPSAAEGKFLRALARKAFDEDVFSVVLTEFFDALHRDHFHLDMARYRIDGTR